MRQQEKRGRAPSVHSAARKKDNRTEVSEYRPLFRYFCPAKTIKKSSVSCTKAVSVPSTATLVARRKRCDDIFNFFRF